MKPILGTIRTLLMAILLWQSPTLFGAFYEITVNSTKDDDVPDTEMTLHEAVLWLNELQGAPIATLGRALSTDESNLVAVVSGPTNRIRFSISGTGPHVITTTNSVDLTGFGFGTYAFPILVPDVVVDGYSQAGSSPNSNPILAANNASLQIVINSSAFAHTVFVVGGDNVKLHGLSVLGGMEPVVFGNGAVGGGVQGCWLGVAPDGSSVYASGTTIGIWSSGGSQVIGTDGDGNNDRGEFNVIVGGDEINVAVGDSVDCRISGNFIGILPNGLSASGYTAAEGDGIYLEDAPDNTIIGTDSNGVSDEDERNIIGGLSNNGTSCDLIECWGTPTNVTVMGNYMGVGIDGSTALPLKRGFSMNVSGAKLHIGSNGDGVRDDLEANIIANITSERVFKFSGPLTDIVFRRNSFFGNTPDFFGDNINSYNGVILGSGDTAVISPSISSASLTEVAGYVPVSGDPAANNRTNAAIHIYEADLAAAANRPQGKKWLATCLDNGPQDLDSQTNYFRFAIAGLAISPGAKLTVNETCGDDLGGGSSRFAAASAALPTTSATEVTVNSTVTADNADNELTLTEAVKLVNGTLNRALTAAEATQVTKVVGGTTNYIRFNISGSGPFVITDIPTQEITASNVVVNGYSQPGASPNTNSILAANNAVLQIVLRSTTGARAFSIFGDNVWLRGLCLRGARIAWGTGDDANTISGGGVQGCWIGLAPDGTVDGGMSYCVATWYSSVGGQVIGTDGDGVNDRNEFNVMVAADEYHVAIASPNCRLSGNFINVLPDGMTASGYAGTECDGIYIEEDASNSVIGTDSDGVSDADERNLVGGLNGSGPCEVIGSWAGATKNLLVMGNYFGVGIDGTTALPNKRGICVDDPGLTMRVGSNEDGMRDALEANIIANTTSTEVFKFSGATTEIIFRRNSFFGNTAIFFRTGTAGNISSYNGAILGSADTAAISPVVSNTTTRAVLIGYVPVSGEPTANNRTNAAIHIYEADPLAAANRPQGKKWLATYLDNGPQDLDTRTNYFQFNICSLPISSTGAKITVNETCGDDLGGGSSRFATAVSLPNVSNSLSISKTGGSVTLTWQMNGVLQTNASLTSPGTWGNVTGCSPVTLPVGAGPLFFRVAQ